MIFRIKSSPFSWFRASFLEKTFLVRMIYEHFVRCVFVEIEPVKKPISFIYSYFQLLINVYCVENQIKDILGQKRNAAYKTYIVCGGLSPISRKRCVANG